MARGGRGVARFGKIVLMREQEIKNCQNCKNNFVIEPKDFGDKLAINKF